MRVCAHNIPSSKNRASREQSNMHTPWIGTASSQMSGFLTTRKISMVTTALTRSARYGTPHRVGGRVAATNNTSAASPSVGSVIARSFLHAEQTADPGDDRLRREHEADADDDPHRPSPGATACRRRDP